MLTGNLQIKNNKYYAVINRKVDGKRKPKWIPLGLPARGNKRQAEALLNRLIAEYEANGEGRNYPADEYLVLKDNRFHSIKANASKVKPCRAVLRIK